MTMDDERTARKFRLIVNSSTRRLRDDCSATISSISMHFEVTDASKSHVRSASGVMGGSSLLRTVEIDRGRQFGRPEFVETLPSLEVTVLTDEPPRRFGREVHLSTDEDGREACAVVQSISERRMPPMRLVLTIQA